MPKSLEYDVTLWSILLLGKEATPWIYHFILLVSSRRRRLYRCARCATMTAWGCSRHLSYTEAGYRLYTDSDFSRLQQILALKFLGFSLDEIQHCLQVGPTRLQEALAMQRTMMLEKREQLDTIIQALDETGKLLQSNEQDWEAIIAVIRVIHMQESNDWRKKYFSDEQLNQMEEWNNRYFTEEQRQKLAEWGKHYSEEDQLRAQSRWGAVIAELKRLVSTGADPASPEAQALASPMAQPRLAVHARRRRYHPKPEKHVQQHSRSTQRNSTLSSPLQQRRGSVPASSY